MCFDADPSKLSLTACKTAICAHHNSLKQVDTSSCWPANVEEDFLKSKSVLNFILCTYVYSLNNENRYISSENKNESHINAFYSQSIGSLFAFLLSPGIQLWNSCCCLCISQWAVKKGSPSFIYQMTRCQMRKQFSWGHAQLENNFFLNTE